MKAATRQQNRDLALSAGKEPQRSCGSDLILTPIQAQEGRRQKDRATAEGWQRPPEVRGADIRPGKELLCTYIPEHQITKAVDPLVLETPQKFFLRMKKKLQQQKDSTPSNPTKQSIPPSTTTEKPLGKFAFPEQLGSDPSEYLATDKDGQDNFIMEAVDADDELSQDTKNICLTSWRIKVMDGNTALCVVGKPKDMKDVVWHSDAIMERIARNQVKTSTGSIYLLEGKINSALMRKEGFPYRFIRRFTYGFSQKWKEYMEEFLEERRRKERKQNSAENEDEESDSVVGADVLKNGKDSAGGVKTPEARNTTYEVLPKNSENTWKNNEKGVSSKREAKSTGSSKARHFISNDDVSDSAVNSAKTKQLSVKLTPLNTRALNKCSSRTPATSKENREAEHGELTVYQEAYKYSLRSAQQRHRDKPLTEEPSSKDEEEESSEDIPLFVKRKTKPILKPEIHNSKASSNCRRSQDDANRVSCEPRTVKHMTATYNVLLRQSVPKSKDGSDLLEGETPSTRSRTSHLPDNAVRTTNRISLPRLIEPDTESESNEEAFHVEEKDLKLSDRKTKYKVADTAKPSAAKSRESEREKVQKPLQLFPRADKKEPVTITAKVGTLKRKQQMRDFLEHLPKDNHDDVFTATPFQNRKVKLPTFRGSQDDDDDAFALTDNPITPSSAVVPMAKTPQCEHISPGMLVPINRNDYDKYVFRMQKNTQGSRGTWDNVKKKVMSLVSLNAT
ncbi:hypothetical protein AAES_141661 [Amazona aestiva]|uniref:SANTA domain-containing protein n=2 Tax=Amazona TaxID=12929 RepID=A0A0Q3PHE6_AMAAE|nr:hypothetical protein AAES_141661 [Amazona aestiva]